MPKKLITEEFIAKAMTIHGSAYDYSLVKYVNNKTKIIIICKEHGEFSTTPDTHYNACCPKCSKRYADINSFIKQCNIVHNYKYDYSDSSYINAKCKIDIKCPDHGLFSQKAANHINGQGCPKCSKNFKITNDDFIRNAISIHGNTFNYNNTKYISMRDKVEIICEEHGSFAQIPIVHILGSGCPKCSSSGFNTSKPSILYYLEVNNNNEVLYKIGISNRSVSERYTKSDLTKINVLKIINFDNGQDALDKETYIKNKYKKFKYTGDKVLSSGNSELFTINIMFD